MTLLFFLTRAEFQICDPWDNYVTSTEKDIFPLSSTFTTESTTYHLLLHWRHRGLESKAKNILKQFCRITSHVSSFKKGIEPYVKLSFNTEYD